MKTSYGEKFVSRDVSDVGSAKEAVSKGFTVIEGGSLTGEIWTRVKAVKDEKGESILKSSKDVAPTDIDLNLNKVVPQEDWTPAMQRYARFVELLAPRLIKREVTMQYIDDDDDGICGCFKWKEGQMTVNLAYHDPEDTEANYCLMLHEFAHNTLHNNDHLHKVFYETVTELGAKLAILTLAEPKLFNSAPNSYDFTEVQQLLGTEARAFAA